MTMTMNQTSRRSIGIWAQWPPEARWSNEGMTRLLGFLIEGIAASDEYVFRVIVPDNIRDAAEDDLRALDAQIGRDFTIHSPRDVAAVRNGDLVAFANRHVPVEVWLSLFPNFSLAVGLERPVTVIFPDAIPLAFTQFGEIAWGPEGAYKLWQDDIRKLLSHARGAIAFSEHVADDHLQALFDFPRDRVTVVPHAPPDLGRLLPFMEQRRRTPESSGHAADLLREECARRNDAYLRDFPFEEVPYVAVSTQDRVTKNVHLAARALLILSREERRDLKMLMTTPLQFEENWAALPSVVSEAVAKRDIVSIPDLPRAQHAALLHCASLVVHPAIFEGGQAPFPFYEAVSIGTPCVMADGPHIRELARTEPGILDFVFDSNDSDGLARLICRILENRDEIIDVQQSIYARLQQNDWRTVARAYAKAALRAAA